MKIQLERWAGWKVGIEAVRHSKADRYTVRIGPWGCSLLVSAVLFGTESADRMERWAMVGAGMIACAMYFVTR